MTEDSFAAQAVDTPTTNKCHHTAPPLFLLIANISKRANIRRLLLTAAAFGCKKVFVVGQDAFDFTADGKDLPNQIKPILQDGKFTIQHFHKWHLCVNHLKDQSIRLVGVEIHPKALSIDGLLASSSNGQWKGTALLMGNEGQGIHEKHMASCDAFVRIPQYGVGTASLNVYVAASIVLQRYHQWQMQSGSHSDVVCTSEA